MNSGVSHTLSKLSALTAWLARPAILFWTLPWLMVLLVAGTVAQKYIGLYAAQKTFFSSFMFWLGPIPLPGGYAVIGVIFTCLLIKFITASRWQWQRAGINLTHFGALVLLAGGLLTAITAREGFMVIAEGGETAMIEDYHARVLTISKDGSDVFSLPQHKIRPGMVLGLDAGLSFNIEILSVMVNGVPEQRTAEVDNKDNLRGPAAKIRMVPAKPEMQNENNHGAVTVAIRGTGTETDGTYLMTEVMPIYPQIEFKNHVYEMRYTKERSVLPFVLALADVEKDSYPGMDMARAYRSRLTIKDQGTTWPAEISMNNPLRYRGYTFYQSSYMQTPAGETTVLSVVWNTGRLFPYIASAIISFGLILHLLISVRGRRAAMIALALLCIIPRAAQADNFNMQDFRMIPVLHEGRLKPLETFARVQLRSLSGSTTVEGLQADEWLAELLFDPVGAATRPVFVVRNRDVMMALSLSKQPHGLYTFAQITAALAPYTARIEVLLQTPPDRLEARQKALIDLHHKVSTYMQLMRSFSLVLPLDIVPPKDLMTPSEIAAFESQPPDYLMLRKWEERAAKRLQHIVRKRGDNIEDYSAEESAVARFVWQLETLSRSSEGNILFRVIPVSWDQEDRVSPWAVLQQGQGSPATAAMLAQWKTLGMAWLNQDKTAWATAAREVRGSSPATQTTHFTIENLYNKINPFMAALVLYMLASTLLIARQNNAALLSLSAGALVHTIGIAARVCILARPPVGTLYESLLFVSLVAVIVGTILFGKRRDVFSGLAAALSGVLLLGVSLYFGMQSGDSLSMLVAVLNTNFWLATHVLIVTAGYGLSILAALLAHAWLYAITDRSGLFMTMHRMGLAALLFTAVGTILGGIWADQSWGRFWGWDPKENGALLIVLWVVWLLHGRMAGQLTPPLYAAGMAALNIVVALAWFGVNLLSVGLHSYGFISGIALGLSIFCTAEVSLVTFLLLRRKRHA